MEIHEQIREITKKKTPRKLTQKERNELKQTVKELENLFQKSAEANDPDAAFSDLLLAFEENVENPFYDCIAVESILEDLEWGRLSEQAAIYKIAMEATGLSILQRL